MGEPAITFDGEAAGYVIDAFGWHLTNKGYIWDDDAVMSITGRPVHIDDLAGIVEYEGEPRPLRDDFNELVEYVKYKHESSNDTKEEGQ
jgi:hypothetical protein